MKTARFGTGIAILTLASGAAFAAVSERDIVANLTAAGYSDISVEIESDGNIEAVAMKDGMEWEIFLDPTTASKTAPEKDPKTAPEISAKLDPKAGDVAVDNTPMAAVNAAA